jgi:hypothetical protein
MNDHTTPVAPPLQPGPLGAVQRAPVWPTVLGVIAVIWGSLSLLGTAVGLLVQGWVPRPAPGEHPEPDAAMLAAVNSPAYQALTTIAGVILGILLVVAGIGLLRRVRWSIGAAKVWSWATIAMALIGTVYLLYVFNDLLAAATPEGQQAPMSQGAFAAMMIGGAVLGLVWALILPVFMLIWFRRGTIRKQYAMWR